MALGQGADFSDLVAKLTLFGLSPNLSKIYVYLLGKAGPTPAKTLVAELGLHRVDAYRALHQLVGLGVVELHILSPNRYTAVEPNLALPLLLSKYENKVSFLKGLRHDLMRRMSTFRSKSISTQNSTAASDYPSQISYRVVSGREGYYEEVRRVIRESKSEVLRIISSLGLELTSSLGFDSEYRKAARRGVSIRLIAEVNAKNAREVKKLSAFVDVRHLEGINARLSVVDKEKTIFGHKFEDSVAAGREKWNCLVLADPQFAEVSRFLFENLWKLASPEIPGLGHAEGRVGNIKGGKREEARRRRGETVGS